MEKSLNIIRSMNVGNEYCESCQENELVGWKDSRSSQASLNLVPKELKEISLKIKIR